MEIIECNHTRKLDKKMTYKKCMTERLMKIDENNFKRREKGLLLGNPEKEIFVMEK